MSTTDEIEDTLAQLSFVQWDRYVGTGNGEVHVYGWIDRPDKYKDFVLVTFYDDGISFITSSGKYSNMISKLLFGEGDEHVPCKRVEDFYQVPNVIRLKKHHEKSY